MEIAAGALGAAAALGSKFTSPSNFTARHEASLRIEEQRVSEQTKEFEGLPGEHVPIEDAFTFEDLRAKAAASRDTYSKSIQEYKETPVYKIGQKRKMRKHARSAKRTAHSANVNLRSFVESAASRSRSGSVASDTVSCDSVSTMAESGSPPNASLEALEASQKVSKWVGTSQLGDSSLNLGIALPKILWKDDSLASTCDNFQCGVPFTFLNRRHHCRVCGGLFCDNCTSHRAHLQESTVLILQHFQQDPSHPDHNTPVKPLLKYRVCDMCWDSTHYSRNLKKRGGVTTFRQGEP